MQDNTTDKELVLQAMREYGQRKAAELQAASAGMSGTELYAAEDYIPDFAVACAQFLSTLPARGATPPFRPSPSPSPFLSTLPARGATERWSMYEPWT